MRHHRQTLGGVLEQRDIVAMRGIEQGTQLFTQFLLDTQPLRVMARPHDTILFGKTLDGLSGAARPGCDGSMVKVNNVRMQWELGGDVS